MKYPNKAGYTNDSTSKEAAEKIGSYKRAKLLHRVEDVLSYFKLGMTAEELAIYLEEDLLNIRPRLTELSELNKAVDSGNRRKNHNNRNVIVWIHKENQPNQERMWFK